MRYKKVKNHSKYIYVKEKVRNKRGKYRNKWVMRTIQDGKPGRKATSIEVGLYKRERRSVAFKNSGNILSIILLVIFSILMMRFIFNPETIGQNFSFQNLLESVKGLGISDKLSTVMASEITADWGAFNFFRNFINTVWAPIKTILTMATSVISFILGVLKFLFISAS